MFGLQVTESSKCDKQWGHLGSCDTQISVGSGSLASSKAMALSASPLGHALLSLGCPPSWSWIPVSGPGVTCNHKIFNLTRTSCLAHISVEKQGKLSQGPQETCPSVPLARMASHACADTCLCVIHAGWGQEWCRWRQGWSEGSVVPKALSWEWFSVPAGFASPSVEPRHVALRP